MATLFGIRLIRGTSGPAVERDHGACDRSSTRIYQSNGTSQCASEVSCVQLTRKVLICRRPAGVAIPSYRGVMLAWCVTIISKLDRHRAIERLSLESRYSSVMSVAQNSGQHSQHSPEPCALNMLNTPSYGGLPPGHVMSLTSLARYDQLLCSVQRQIYDEPREYSRPTIGLLMQEPATAERRAGTKSQSVETRLVKRSIRSRPAATEHHEHHLLRVTFDGMSSDGQHRRRGTSRIVQEIQQQDTWSRGVKTVGASITQAQERDQLAKSSISLSRYVDSMILLRLSSGCMFSGRSGNEAILGPAHLPCFETFRSIVRMLFIRLTIMRASKQADRSRR